MAEMRYKLHIDGVTPEARGEIENAITVVPNFPRPGLVFKDLSPVLGSPLAYKTVIDGLVARYQSKGITGLLPFLLDADDGRYNFC
eukprot:3439822-Rhodomonas_salina.2